MAQAPPPKRIVEILPSVEEELSALGSANAPIIYFEAAAGFGHIHGSIVRVTLTASRIMSRGGQVMADHVVVAHLRMSNLAAQSLRDALDKALRVVAMPAPVVPPGSKPN
jgi:hypothetical protein